MKGGGEGGGESYDSGNYNRFNYTLILNEMLFMTNVNLLFTNILYFVQMLKEFFYLKLFYLFNSQNILKDIANDVHMFILDSHAFSNHFKNVEKIMILINIFKKKKKLI